MTGPSGIAGAAAAPLGGAKAKLPDAAPDDAARSGADSSEFAAFSELFAFIEAEENPAAVPVRGAGDARRADDDQSAQDTDTDKDGDADTASPVLLAEMTHYQWFGVNLAAAAAASADAASAPADPSATASAPMVVAKAALSQNLDLPEPVREFIAKSGEMRGLQAAASAGTGAGAGAGQKTMPAADLPGDAARTPAAPASPADRTPASPLPAASAAPAAAVPQPPLPAAPPAAASPAQADLPQTANAAGMQPEPPTPAPARASASEPRPAEPLSADAKASLLALETVLSKSGSSTKDSTDGGGDRQPGMPQLKEVRVSMIQSETHFAPVAPLQPVFQIVGHIDREMRGPAPQALLPATNDPRPDTPPVRVLNIQLDPPQLGPLTIRISLKEGALNLQLETARHETASLIQTDKDTLSGLLRSAGYVVDGLNVQVAAPDRTPPAAPPASNSAGGFNFNQAMGQDGGSRQSDGRPAGRTGTYGRQADSSAGSSHDTQGPGAVKPRSGSVYL